MKKNEMKELICDAIGFVVILFVLLFTYCILFD